MTVYGWAQRQRDLGNLIFIDLRDRTGILQLSFNDATDREIFAKAQSVRSEYVLAATGTLQKRESVNKELKTGEIELAVTDLRVLSKAQTPPFEIANADKVGDETTLKYRYLHLRNERLTRNLLMRHKIAKIAREYFYGHDFVEIETPMLIKSTPEGARDYVVPSRVHKGLRADRQPEFTQIDLEMSFVDCEDIMQMAEGFIQTLMAQTVSVDIAAPLPRMTYADAMARYGSDKPDTRFDMCIEDITDWAKGTDFVVFQNAIAAGGTVRCIVAKNAAAAYTRKKIDKLTEHARGIGAGGLAYVRWADETPTCSFNKFLKAGQLDALLTQLGAEKGDCVFIISDKTSKALPILGALRLMVAKELDIIPKGKWNFLWITEMPFFEQDGETGEWIAMHHPFTMPMEECLPYLDTDKARVRAKAFDLVLNGIELSSGSMRITDCQLQNKMFELLGLSKEEIDAKFGFLVEAYQYAAPPHGGMGIGLDRLAMLICGADSLRDVTAFPKVQNASELMSGCPAEIDAVQLEELGMPLPEADA